jgi:hypothetical protein
MIGYGTPCMTTCTVDMGQLKPGDIPHSTHMCGADDASHLGEHTCRTCAAPFVGKTGPALNPPAPRHERTVDLSAFTEHFRALTPPPAPPVRRSFRDRKAGQPPTEMQQVQAMLAAHADIIATMQRQQDAQRRIVLGHTDRLKALEGVTQTPPAGLIITDVQANAIMALLTLIHYDDRARQWLAMLPPELTGDPRGV